MVLCDDNLMNCYPCCDFCIHAVHEKWEEDGIMHTGGPIGCKLHPDEEHQEIAEDCSCCQDFQCFRADKLSGKWFERDIEKLREKDPSI